MSADPSETFRQEAAELLDALEQGLLDLSATPHNRELVDAAFRALHTLKGSGAMFGFAAVADFVHHLETAFDRVRKGIAPVTPTLIAVALASKDAIARLIDHPDLLPQEMAALLAGLARLDDGSAPADEPAPVAVPPPPPPAAPRRVAVEVYLPPDTLMRGTNPALIVAELRALGVTDLTLATDRVPSLADLDPETCHLGWRFTLAHADPAAALADVFLFLQDGLDLRIDPIDPPSAAPPPPVAAPEPRTSDRSPDRAGATLRIPAERLDTLMDGVGELVIAQARLAQLTAAHADPALTTVAEDIDRLVARLRDTTMSIRMVPIGSLFARFRRLVHDLSADLGKPIELITTGEETALDKTMIERLADPLVHLIRNAVDHGLEAPAARAAAHKPATGTVRLAAVYAGGEVAITISDDGAGLDTARIRARAIANGLIAPDARLSESDLHQLIFAPGFSTAATVTALSGRGVGMDVVKRTIEALRGKIALDSTPGAGTSVTLRLPLTLAIIDGLLVRVGEGSYAIPLAAVEDCVALPLSGVLPTTRGRPVLDWRGRLVPVLPLRDTLGEAGAPPPFAKIVVVSAGGRCVGLVVDQILGTAQTVIKQLSRLHAGLPHVTGATILGDGRVALIVDTARLVQEGGAVIPFEGEAA